MSDRFDQGHACVIGIGGDLPTTVNDAKGLAKILKDPERCAYPENQVQLLTGEQATRSNIMTALETLANTTNAESTVLIYFSGHGHQLIKPLKSYYLMPHGYNTEDLPETAISGGEFTDLLREIPAQKLLVVLDCCHAGGLSDLSSFQVTKAPLPPEAQRMFAKGGGRIMIGSSQPNELSYAGEPYSAFTYTVIKGLCGAGAVKQDGYIRATDLAMYASRFVPTLTDDKQHPVLDIEKADNFILAYYAGGQLQPKGLPSELENEPTIEAKPGELNGQIIHNTNIVASGDRAIAVGGGVSGGTFVTGDGNVVGSGNTIQHGKYNFKAHSVSGLQIGDTYNSSEQKIGKEKRLLGDQTTLRKRESATAQNPELPPDSIGEKEVFISYAWAGKSEEIANQIEKALKENDISLVRDKNHLGFKGRIKAFMERIGRGKCVVVVISEKYLKSENCMFELLQIAKNEQFYERIFPVVLDDAKIYKPKDRIQYVQYWEQQIQELDQQIRSVSSANLEGFREDIDLYNEIRQYLPRLTNILKDMNTLTAQIHSESGACLQTQVCWSLGLEIT